jgi:predicted transcriptional regulator
VKREPAIPVKRSVTAAHITWLECGKQFSMLKRRLMTDHKLTPERYRQKWDLAPSYPVVAPDYAETRSALAGFDVRKNLTPPAVGGFASNDGDEVEH